MGCRAGCPTLFSGRPPQCQVPGSNPQLAKDAWALSTGAPTPVGMGTVAATSQLRCTADELDSGTLPQLSSCTDTDEKSLSQQPSLDSANTRLKWRKSFLPEERHNARSLARFSTASEGWQRPVALWIVGPSAVGKTMQSSLRAKHFGIRDCDDEFGCVGPDAVVVDGEFFRDTHEAYQAWTQTDDWEAAYPAVKSRINREKKDMLNHAEELKKHLIIPQTCLDLPSCLDEVRQLTDGGYVNHVIAITAPREEVARRGTRRAMADGKVYNSNEFDRAVVAIEPMLKACNGCFQRVYVKEKLEGDKVTFEVTVTEEGFCGKYSNELESLSLVDVES